MGNKTSDDSKKEVIKDRLRGIAAIAYIRNVTEDEIDSVADQILSLWNKKRLSK